MDNNKKLQLPPRSMEPGIKTNFERIEIINPLMEEEVSRKIPTTPHGHWNGLDLNQR